MHDPVKRDGDRLPAGPHQTAHAPESPRITFWPKKILGPAPGLKEFNVVLWGLFLTCFAGPLLIQLWARLNVGPVGDFVYFYGDGRIADEFQPQRLYDYSLQLKVFDEIDPARGNHYGPSPYPPFVALFFGLLARFPYRAAYILWFLISLALYVLGVASVIREAFPNDRIRSSLALCLALAFPPFLVNTLVSGQISSIAVCAIGVGLANERSRPFRSGLALSLLTYKPTLLLLILPMLILRRRGRSLLGFASGALTLALVATALDGVRIWPTYIGFLNFFRQISQMSGMLKRWEFVDLTSFASLTLRGESAQTHFVLTSLLIGLALWLAVLLSKTATANKAVSYLAWATTLTWTLLFNLYVPMYDSILVAIALILTIGALRGAGCHTATRWTALLGAAILVTSWKSQAIAETHKIQWLTVLFLAFGLSQIIFLHRMILRGDRDQDFPELPATSDSVSVHGT